MSSNCYKDCFILRNRDNEEFFINAYDGSERDKMMVDISKRIYFEDWDDAFAIVDIYYRGRQIEYTGWQPEMLFQYEYVDTGDLAWEGRFPQWHH